MDDNLVRRNATNGIRLTMGSAAAKKNEVTSNSSIENGNDGAFTSRRSSTQNTVDMNSIAGNGDGLVDTSKCVSGSG